MTVAEKVDVLLVGGGVASVRCARTLRRSGFDGSILLVGAEAWLPYNRPPLSKELLREDLPDELVLAERAAWYERRGIDLLLGVAIVGLDADARVATLDDGSRIRFDRCLLATGAEPRRLPIPGFDRALELRTLDDARAIATIASPGTRVAIIGGGFIGVEVASSLAAREVEVTVVEARDALWGGALGPELSAWARAQLTGIGVAVETGATVQAVEAGGLALKDGLLSADFVVAGVGVAPREALARDAGLAVDGGIVADGRHRTSAVGIFTAGDVARVDGLRVEHWHAAREGGERAALSMLDRPIPARRAPWVFSEVAGRSLDVVGMAAAWDRIERIGEGDRFSLAYLADGRVVQIASIDGAMPVEEARAAVERVAAIGEIG